MINNMALTVFTAALLAATVLFAPCTPSAAQAASAAASSEFSAQQQQGKKDDKKGAAPARKSAPNAARQQKATPHAVRQQKTAPRVVRQQKTTPKAVRQQKTTTRAVRQPKATQRVVKQRKTTPKGAAATVTRRKVESPAARQIATPQGAKAVTASRLRGVPTRGTRRAVIRGHNYSAWRSGHRVRHGSGWRTFVALSALSAIMVGSDEYYPYAYISAPEPYCEGVTEDGCELRWQQVETVEGDVIDQCVAYCPWQ